MEATLKNKFSLLILFCMLFTLCSCSFSPALSLKSDEIFGSVEIDGEIQTITATEYTIDRYKNTFCRYLVFPEELLSDTAEAFIYGENRGSDRGRVFISEIFLSCTYSQEIYDSEIERLASIETKHVSRVSPIIYTKELFALPAYVAIYNDSSEFEYAVVDATSLTICYIYLFAVGDSSNIIFDSKYIPQKLLSQCNDLDPLFKHDRYNIYT